jgi:hypothetical protein
MVWFNDRTDRSGHTARSIVIFDNLVGTIVASIASVPAPRRKPTGRQPTLHVT